MACGDGRREPADPPEELHEQIAELYGRARESGEEVSDDVYEWARGDIERIGDWQYRVVERGPEPPGALEEALNALGTERWQLVWMERRDGVWLVVHSHFSLVPGTPAFTHGRK